MFFTKVQFGGGSSRRLRYGEFPLIVQDDFFMEIGYNDASRRSRLAVDSDLKYIIRFYLGPAPISVCPQMGRSGTVGILKGLVFPQWKRRSVAICGNQLFLFPGNSVIC